MKKEFLKALFVVIGTLLFNMVFWKEKMALNTLFFDGFVLSAVFYLYPMSRTNNTVKLLLLGHLITIATVIIQNTLLSKLAFSISLLLLIAFIQYVHRSVWYAAGSIFSNYFLISKTFYATFSKAKVKPARSYSISRVVRFLIIPLVIVVVFYIIYAASNDVFKDIMDDIGEKIALFFSNFFDWFNWQRILFLLLGLFITVGLLLKTKTNYFSIKDITKEDVLLRKRKSLKKWKQSNAFDALSLVMGKLAEGNLALKNENIVGIISLALLNLLLLFINCIDIVYVWFGFTFKYDMNLSDYVHEGTWLLILSIVLAMSVLLFFFRGNLNFYQKNKWLRVGAYGWIFQNMILVISVLIRDYYYIAHYGLAYKRIGVLFFLVMVLTGLITIFLKIYQRRTNYYLLRVNAWVAIVLLVLSSCVNWDETIAKYNLARKNTIKLDVKFLLSLSDKTLPLIEKNKDILDKDSTIEIDVANFYPKTYLIKDYFEQRKKDFFNEQKEYSWLSWNEADAYTKQHLNN
ncbi:DUF4153 domain-containing protein [Ferruginibacter albus]|uniref:DUF4153 domain-containing protein n=1 Tax=Ferruginibacter albus TaxID=2875540 RepID=UPI001CC7D402|nr:DUF4173 domain-containing protein [Ferruginibacter albus]UAY51677.1 DUF4173 domain-containing protein [Ferruginibacter albus]